MLFKYSCFISYRASRTKLTTTFIKQLKEALDGEIATQLDREVYIDSERIRGGEWYNESLARALCESLCMILIFTPNYFSKEKTFCTREYLTMKILEQKRLETIRGKCDSSLRFIIPIIFRGPKHLPSEIKEYRHYYDFSQYTLADTEIMKHKDYNKYIKEISSEIIAELAKCFDDVDQEKIFLCKNLDLPTVQEAKNWLETLDTPPFEFPGP